MANRLLRNCLKLFMMIVASTVICVLLIPDVNVRLVVYMVLAAILAFSTDNQFRLRWPWRR